VVEAAFGDIEPALVFGRARSDPRNFPAADGRAHADIGAFCLVLDRPLDWTAFGIWLTMLLQARGGDLFRVKGLLDVGAEGPLLLNGVQHVVHPPEHLDAWPDDDRRSRIVFIGRGLDPAAVERSLLAFNSASH
jgi:G3E family GTPase